MGLSHLSLSSYSCTSNAGYEHHLRTELMGLSHLGLSRYSTALKAGEEQQLTTATSATASPGKGCAASLMLLSSTTLNAVEEQLLEQL